MSEPSLVKLNEMFKAAGLKPIVEADFQGFEVKAEMQAQFMEEPKTFEPRTIEALPYPGPKGYPSELLTPAIPEPDVSVLFEELEHRIMESPLERELHEQNLRQQSADRRVRTKYATQIHPRYAPAKLPLTMRLVYDFADRKFEAGNSIDFLFNLFECSQKLIEEYEIWDEPSAVELHVWRPEWKSPLSMFELPPGQWIKVMDFRVLETTPFFSFEELDLVCEIMWNQVRWYAQRSMNLCSEIPLIEQGLGSFFPKG